MLDIACNAGVFWQTSAFLSRERKRRKRVQGSGSEAANMAANLLCREPIPITREHTLPGKPIISPLLQGIEKYLHVGLLGWIEMPIFLYMRYGQVGSNSYSLSRSVYFCSGFVICKGINPTPQIWKKNLYCSASGKRKEFVAPPDMTDSSKVACSTLPDSSP